MEVLTHYTSPRFHTEKAFMSATRSLSARCLHYTAVATAIPTHWEANYQPLWDEGPLSGGELKEIPSG